MATRKKVGRSLHFTINGILYKSAKALREHVQTRMHGVPQHAVFSDQPWWRDYVSLHPSFAEKIAVIGSLCSVAHGERTGEGTNLKLIGDQGREIFISWHAPIDGHQPGRKRQKVLTALRDEVYDQIVRFRDGVLQHGPWSMSCGICDAHVSRDDIHVDHHEPQFNELVEGFCRSLHVTLEAIETETDQHDYTKRRLKDGQMAIVWREYHRTNATLRVTCAGCNMQREIDRRKEAS